VPDPRLLRILEQLRASKFAEVKGARVAATIPVPERLLNEIVTAALPQSAPVREVSVHPKAANRLAVRAKLARLDFLPPFTLTLEIERQPQLPETPLVLRVLSFPGLMPIAGAALSMASSLPPGLRLDGDRLLIDVRVVLERNGLGEVLPYLEDLRVTTDEGVVVVQATLTA
jgi:hypothetical protein